MGKVVVLTIAVMFAAWLLGGFLKTRRR